MKNYLGLDWGAAKVGVALAHAETQIAMAYATYENNASLLKTVGEIIVAENVGIVIIGIPSYLHKNAAQYEGKTLGEMLEKKFAVRVEYQDEMFTTKMAQANLKERGMKAISQHDDTEAARIILQEWLNKKAHT